MLIWWWLLEVEVWIVLVVWRMKEVLEEVFRNVVLVGCLLNCCCLDCGDSWKCGFGEVCEVIDGVNCIGFDVLSCCCGFDDFFVVLVGCN